MYIVFGLIAFDLATGDHSGKPSSQGALTEMAQQPYGTWLLGIVALGLFAYAVACALEPSADEAARRPARATPRTA